MLATGVLQLIIGLAMIVVGIVVLPAALLGLAIGGVSLVAVGAFFVYLGVPSRERREAKSKGQRAKAKVLSVQKTSAGYAANPMLEIELEVRPPNGSPYLVKKKFLTSRFKPPKSGDEIDVRVTDPADPESIELG